jgi:hypothetical protein
MNTFTEIVRRECALRSPKAPLWFRVLKWAALLPFAARCHAASWSAIPGGTS